MLIENSQKIIHSENKKSRYISPFFSIVIFEFRLQFFDKNKTNSDSRNDFLLAHILLKIRVRPRRTRVWSQQRQGKRTAASCILRPRHFFAFTAYCSHISFFGQTKFRRNTLGQSRNFMLVPFSRHPKTKIRMPEIIAAFDKTGLAYTYIGKVQI